MYSDTSSNCFAYVTDSVSLGWGAVIWNIFLHLEIDLEKYFLLMMLMRGRRLNVKQSSHLTVVQSVPPKYDSEPSIKV